MKPTYLLPILLTAAVAAHAESLKADAVVCEVEAPLAQLAKPNLAGQPGTVVMQRMDATVQFLQMSHQANGQLADLAAKDEAVRTAYGARGSSQVQAGQAANAQQQAQDELQLVQAFRRQCMATGTQAVAVSVIERRPISGGVHIRMPIKGTPADVWTVAGYLD